MHPGLRFVCGAKNGVSIVYRYRHPKTNTQRQLFLGHFGNKTDGLVDLEQAREIHGELRTQLRAGRVPELPTTKGENLTVNDLCDFYLERFAKRNKRSWKQDEDRMNRHIRPKLGDKPALALTYEDVQLVTFDLFNFGGKNKHGAPKEAKEVRALISRIYSVCSGVRTKGAVPIPCLPRNHTNPAQLAEELEYEPNQYSPTVQDMTAFMKNGGLYFKKGWKSLLFQAQTFSRVSEVAKMDWDDIDLERSIWTIPVKNSKNKQEQKVYLSKQSRKLLLELTGERSGRVFGASKDYVCHIVSKKRHLVGMSNRMSSHDLRRAGLTWVQEMGGSKDVRDRLSNHKPSKNDVDATYAKATLEAQCREWTQNWCDYLDELSTQ